MKKALLILLVAVVLYSCDDPTTETALKESYSVENITLSNNGQEKSTFKKDQEILLRFEIRPYVAIDSVKWILDGQETQIYGIIWHGVAGDNNKLIAEVPLNSGDVGTHSIEFIIKLGEDSISDTVFWTTVE